jgi:hypothetical protein
VGARAHGSARVVGDRLDRVVTAVRPGVLSTGVVGHAAAGLDVVGVAQQFGQLNPRGDLVGGRVVGQLGRLARER